MKVTIGQSKILLRLEIYLIIVWSLILIHQDRFIFLIAPTAETSLGGNSELEDVYSFGGNLSKATNDCNPSVNGWPRSSNMSPR